jgi:hypothetical protein
MQFMFVVLRVGWVCDQNLWHQFVKANTPEDLITYMKGGPNFILEKFLANLYQCCAFILF